MNDHTKLKNVVHDIEDLLDVVKSHSLGQLFGNVELNRQIKALKERLNSATEIINCRYNHHSHIMGTVDACNKCGFIKSNWLNNAN